MTPTQERLHKEHQSRRAKFWPQSKMRRAIRAASEANASRPAINATWRHDDIALPPAADLCEDSRPKTPIMETIRDCSALEVKTFFMSDTIRLVAKYYGISGLEIISERRSAPVVRARQVAMWICKNTTRHSLPAIGRAMGGRDHTTILHGLRKIDALLKTDDLLASQIAELFDRVAEAKA